MRSRDEIQMDIAESNAENNGNDTVALIQLEVLLDVRDLLKELAGCMESITFDVGRM